MEKLKKKRRGAILLSEAAKRNQRFLETISLGGSRHTKRIESSSRFYRPQYDSAHSPSLTITRPRSLYDYKGKYFGTSGVSKSPEPCDETEDLYIESQNKELAVFDIHKIGLGLKTSKRIEKAKPILPDEGRENTRDSAKFTESKNIEYYSSALNFDRMTDDFEELETSKNDLRRYRERVSRSAVFSLNEDIDEDGSLNISSPPEYRSNFQNWRSTASRRPSSEKERNISTFRKPESREEESKKISKGPKFFEYDESHFEGRNSRTFTGLIEAEEMDSRQLKSSDFYQGYSRERSLRMKNWKSESYLDGDFLQKAQRSSAEKGKLKGKNSKWIDVIEESAQNSDNSKQKGVRAHERKTSGSNILPNMFGIDKEVWLDRDYFGIGGGDLCKMSKKFSIDCLEELAENSGKQSQNNRSFSTLQLQSESFKTKGKRPTQMNDLNSRQRNVRQEMKHSVHELNCFLDEGFEELEDVAFKNRLDSIIEGLKIETDELYGTNLKWPNLDDKQLGIKSERPAVSSDVASSGLRHLDHAANEPLPNASVSEVRTFQEVASPENDIIGIMKESNEFVANNSIEKYDHSYKERKEIDGIYDDVNDGAKDNDTAGNAVKESTTRSFQKCQDSQGVEVCEEQGIEEVKMVDFKVNVDDFERTEKENLQSDSVQKCGVNTSKSEGLKDSSCSQKELDISGEIYQNGTLPVSSNEEFFASNRLLKKSTDIEQEGILRKELNRESKGEFQTDSRKVDILTDEPIEKRDDEKVQNASQTDAIIGMGEEKWREDIGVIEQNVKNSSEFYDDQLVAELQVQKARETDGREGNGFNAAISLDEMTLQQRKRRMEKSPYKDTETDLFGDNNKEELIEKLVDDFKEIDSDLERASTVKSKIENTNLNTVVCVENKQLEATIMRLRRRDSRYLTVEDIEEVKEVKDDQEKDTEELNFQEISGKKENAKERHLSIDVQQEAAEKCIYEVSKSLFDQSGDTDIKQSFVKQEDQTTDDGSVVTLNGVFFENIPSKDLEKKVLEAGECSDEQSRLLQVEEKGVDSLVHQSDNLNNKDTSDPTKRLIFDNSENKPSNLIESAVKMVRERRRSLGLGASPIDRLANVAAVEDFIELMQEDGSKTNDLESELRTNESVVKCHKENEQYSTRSQDFILNHMDNDLSTNRSSTEKELDNNTISNDSQAKASEDSEQVRWGRQKSGLVPEEVILTDIESLCRKEYRNDVEESPVKDADDYSIYCLRRRESSASYKNDVVATRGNSVDSQPQFGTKSDETQGKSRGDSRRWSWIKRESESTSKEDELGVISSGTKQEIDADECQTESRDDSRRWSWMKRGSKSASNDDELASSFDCKEIQTDERRKKRRNDSRCWSWIKRESERTSKDTDSASIRSLDREEQSIDSGKSSTKSRGDSRRWSWMKLESETSSKDGDFASIGSFDRKEQSIDTNESQMKSRVESRRWSWIKSESEMTSNDGDLASICSFDRKEQSIDSGESQTKSRDDSRRWSWIRRDSKLSSLEDELKNLQGFPKEQDKESKSDENSTNSRGDSRRWSWIRRQSESVLKDNDSMSFKSFPEKEQDSETESSKSPVKSRGDSRRLSWVKRHSQATDGKEQDLKEEKEDSRRWSLRRRILEAASNDILGKNGSFADNHAEGDIKSGRADGIEESEPMSNYEDAESLVGFDEKESTDKRMGADQSPTKSRGDSRRWSWIRRDSKMMSGEDDFANIEGLSRKGTEIDSEEGELESRRNSRIRSKRIQEFKESSKDEDVTKFATFDKDEQSVDTDESRVKSRGDTRHWSRRIKDSIELSQDEDLAKIVGFNKEGQEVDIHKDHPESKESTAITSDVVLKKGGSLDENRLDMEIKTDCSEIGNSRDSRRLSWIKKVDGVESLKRRESEEVSVNEGLTRANIFDISLDFKDQRRDSEDSSEDFKTIKQYRELKRKSQIFHNEEGKVKEGDFEKNETKEQLSDYHEGSGIEKKDLKQLVTEDAERRRSDLESLQGVVLEGLVTPESANLVSLREKEINLEAIEDEQKIGKVLMSKKDAIFSPVPQVDVKFASKMKTEELQIQNLKDNRESTEIEAERLIGEIVTEKMNAESETIDESKTIESISFDKEAYEIAEVKTLKEYRKLKGTEWKLSLGESDIYGEFELQHADVVAIEESKEIELNGIQMEASGIVTVEEQQKLNLPKRDVDSVDSRELRWSRRQSRLLSVDGNEEISLKVENLDAIEKERPEKESGSEDLESLGPETPKNVNCLRQKESKQSLEVILKETEKKPDDENKEKIPGSDLNFNQTENDDFEFSTLKEYRSWKRGSKIIFGFFPEEEEIDLEKVFADEKPNSESLNEIRTVGGDLDITIANENQSFEEKRLLSADQQELSSQIIESKVEIENLESYGSIIDKGPDKEKLRDDGRSRRRRSRILLPSNDFSGDQEQNLKPDDDFNKIELLDEESEGLVDVNKAENFRERRRPRRKDLFDEGSRDEKELGAGTDVVLNRTDHGDKIDQDEIAILKDYRKMKQRNSMIIFDDDSEEQKAKIGDICEESENSKGGDLMQLPSNSLEHENLNDSQLSELAATRACLDEEKRRRRDLASFSFEPSCFSKPSLGAKETKVDDVDANDENDATVSDLKRYERRSKRDFEKGTAEKEESGSEPQVNYRECTAKIQDHPSVVIDAKAKSGSTTESELSRQKEDEYVDSRIDDVEQKLFTTKTLKDYRRRRNKESIDLDAEEKKVGYTKKDKTSDAEVQKEERLEDIQQLNAKKREDVGQLALKREELKCSNEIAAKKIDDDWDIDMDKVYINRVTTEGGISYLGREEMSRSSSNVKYGSNRLSEKQAGLTAGFDDFELKMRKMKEKMRSLLDKNSAMEERIEYGRDEDIHEDRQWEYFQQQNKLIQLAVSKLWQKEGYDPSRLIKDENYDNYNNFRWTKR